LHEDIAMNRLKRIMLGVDFSAGSHAALRKAVRLARANRARLRALHVVDANLVAEAAWASGRTAADLGRELVVQAESLMRTALRRARSPAETKTAIDCDVPIEAMLRHCEAFKPDLLVLGLNGVSWAGTGAGMFAMRCLRKVNTKVLLVSPQQHGPFRSIVACVDFSETARTVVAQALRVAAQDKCRVQFLNVYDPPWLRFGFRAESPRASWEYARNYRARRRQRLKEFTGATACGQTSHHLHECGSPGRGIAEFARRRPGTLLVLGRRGLTNLKYVLLGSTAERLARELSQSILVVPPTSGLVAAPILTFS